MTPRDVLSQIQALVDRHHLLPHEPLPEFVPDDQPLTYEGYRRLSGWVDDLIRERFESHCFWFDMETIRDNVTSAPRAFRGVQTDGEPVFFPSTDQTCHGAYLPEDLARDLKALFSPIEEAVEAALPTFRQRHWWRR